MSDKLPPVLEGIATSSPDDLHLHAVRHPIPLADLPIAGAIGLPVTGAIELDIDLRVPITGGRHDPVRSRGTIAIRTTERCRIGDDATPLQHPKLAGIMPGGLPFTHVDLDAVHAELTVADGRAVLTRFEVSSPDLELHLDLTITLTRYFLDSALAGTVRFRATDAFAARDPLLTGLLSLFNLSRDPAGLATIPLSGTLRSPRRGSAGDNRG